MRCPLNHERALPGRSLINYRSSNAPSFSRGGATCTFRPLAALTRTTFFMPGEKFDVTLPFFFLPSFSPLSLLLRHSHVSSCVSLFSCLFALLTRPNISCMAPSGRTSEIIGTIRPLSGRMHSIEHLLDIRGGRASISRKRADRSPAGLANFPGERLNASLKLPDLLRWRAAADKNIDQARGMPHRLILHDTVPPLPYRYAVAIVPRAGRQPFGKNFNEGFEIFS